MSGHVRRGFAAFLVAAGFATPAAANSFTDLFSFNAAPQAAAAAPAPAAPAAAAAPAQDDCLRQPGKTTDPGQHWVYRYDGHRRCWFQTEAGAARVRKPVRHHAARRPVVPAEESEDAPRKQRAVEDARAELLTAAPAQTSPPTPPAPEIKVVDAAPAPATGAAVPAPATGAAALVPPAPVLAQPGADPLPADQAAPRHVDVERLLAEAPAASDEVAAAPVVSAPPATPVAAAPPATPAAIAPVRTDGGGGGTANWLGVLLIALGIAALSSSSRTLRRALWPVRSPQARSEIPAIADDGRSGLLVDRGASGQVAEAIFLDYQAVVRSSSGLRSRRPPAPRREPRL